MVTMTIREFIDKESDRKARIKRPPTLADVALAWANKCDSIIVELHEQIVLEQFDYLTDTYLDKLRESVDQLDNALAWIKSEQKEKEGANHA